MGAGKKFNAKKEKPARTSRSSGTASTSNAVCSSQITYRTDPKNGDYELEQGATRIFELRKEQDRERDEAKAAAWELEEGNDAMAAVEAKAKASRREMDSLALEHAGRGPAAAGIGPDDIIHRLHEQHAVGVALAGEGASKVARRSSKVKAAKSGLMKTKQLRVPRLQRSIRKLEDTAVDWRVLRRRPHRPLCPYQALVVLMGARKRIGRRGVALLVAFRRIFRD